MHSSVAMMRLEMEMETEVQVQVEVRGLITSAWSLHTEPSQQFMC